MIVDGALVPPEAWARRRAAELVALLALADGHRLARDRVIDALWPTLDSDAGAANLRKAAHHARHATGDPQAVVLRGGVVSLFPSRVVATDVREFERAAKDDDAVAAYAGDLLPEAPYEEWTQAPRERLRSAYLELLRRTGRWERLVEVEPTDEPAIRELMRQAVAEGSRPAAIRWFGRLRVALRREMGIAPSAETIALYDACVAGLGSADPAFVGRALELARVTALLRSQGDEDVLAVRGPGGIGKSALCREIGRLAAAEGWRAIAVAATDVGGPYDPLVAVTEELVARDRCIARRGRRQAARRARASWRRGPPPRTP